LDLQDNNCMTLDSAPFARVYANLFDLLWGWPSSLKPAAVGSFSVCAVDLALYFAPNSTPEVIEGAIADAINKATRLRVMAFVMSDPGILQSLHDRCAAKKFPVQGIYDPMALGTKKEAATRQTDPLYWWLRDPRFRKARSHSFQNAPGAKGESDFMHDKLMIVDDNLVITGSYNFSENAEKNAENILFIRSTDVATAYAKYFDAVYGNAHP